MRTHTAILGDPEGFHMRPAGLFASAMNNFDSSITLCAQGKEVDGKSLMQIMTCGFKHGTPIEIICDGSDEDEALEAAIQGIEKVPA